MVTFGFHSSFHVIFSPSKRSSRRNLSAYRAAVFFMLDSGPQRLNAQNDDSSHDDVNQSERDHPLPTQIHQLIEAESRESPSNPDVEDHEEHYLGQKDQDGDE